MTKVQADAAEGTDERATDFKGNGNGNGNRNGNGKLIWIRPREASRCRLPAKS
jgi:hypothetical protein